MLLKIPKNVAIDWIKQIQIKYLDLMKVSLDASKNRFSSKK
jgi:hypothetical protein